MTNKSSKDRGRKLRPTFNLGTHHPLYTSHARVTQMKMCTPMLAAPPPLQNFLVIDQPKMNHLFPNGTKTWFIIADT